MKDIKIIIATHKQYTFPEGNCYIPIQVGKALNNKDLNILGDCSGDNISIKNKTFCELTALYWAWKNNFFSDCDYAGLVHYRRYFYGQRIDLLGNSIASEEELLLLLSNYDCIVPKKRNYYIESVYDHYKNAHYIKDLELTKEVLQELYPDYLQAFEKVMSGRELYLFNMFIMKRELLCVYCEWLFKILFVLEPKLNLDHYNDYQKRVFGFISERLFNVWLLKNNLSLKEVKIVTLEKESIIIKAVGLLKRKFLNSRGRK